MKNFFKKRVLSVLLAIFTAMELFPLTAISVHAADPTDSTINFEYSSKYDTPEDAIISFAQDGWSRKDFTDKSSFTANDKNNWVSIYDGDLTVGNGKLRDALQSDEPGDEHIILAEDVELRLGKTTWVPIKITSDKVLDLNGYTLTLWDFTNKEDGTGKTAQAENPNNHYVNKYFMEIAPGATLTIIDSSMNANYSEDPNGTGAIVTGAYMVDPFDEQIDYYTTRDLFRVNGNLVIYGGTFKAGRQKEQQKSNFSWEKLFDCIGSTITLGISIAEYATGIEAADAVVADTNTQIQKEIEAEEEAKKQKEKNTSDADKKETATEKKDGTGGKKEQKVETPTSAKPEENNATETVSLLASSEKGDSSSGRNQTVKEKTESKEASGDKSGSAGNKTEGQGEGSGGEGSGGKDSNKSNKEGTAKEDKQTRLAAAEKGVVDAWLNKEKLTSILDSTRTVVEKVAGMIGTEEGTRVVQAIHGTVARVGSTGTMVVYGGLFQGHGATENVRNAVIEVVRRNLDVDTIGLRDRVYGQEYKYGGQVYVYGGTFEGYAGANIFNMVRSQSNIEVTIQNTTYDNETGTLTPVTEEGKETRTITLPEWETGGMEVLHYENQDEVKNGVELGEQVPVDTSNVMVRGGTFRCYYEIANVGVRNDQMKAADPKGDKSTFIRVIGTSGSVNLGVSSYGEDMIRDGRIQLTDTYGDGALVLMDQTADESHPTGLTHYRLYCGDTELRHIRYLDVAPNTAQTNSTHSFALTTFYGDSNLSNMSTWNSENDLENDHTAPFASDEYFFDYEFDGIDANDYYVMPTLDGAKYIKNPTSAINSDVWYYNSPLDGKGQPIGNFSYTRTYAHYLDKYQGTWFYQPIDTYENLDRFDEEHINKESFYRETQENWRTDLKWFRYRIYRVDPITLENISEGKYPDDDVPLFEIVYGVDPANDALKSKLPLGALEEAIIEKTKGTANEWTGYQKGEMYRIVFNVEEYLNYGYTVPEEENIDDVACRVSYVSEDEFKVYMYNRDSDQFAAELPVSSTESSILFRCSSVTEKTAREGTTPETNIHYETDYTPLQFDSVAVLAGQTATINFVNAKVSMADNAGNDFIDVYYQWYVSDSPIIEPNSEDDMLLAGTTNVNLDWEEKSEHKPVNWNPEADDYEYRNSLSPEDPNYEAYGEDGLPDRMEAWTMYDLHAYTTELRQNELCTVNPSKPLTIRNNDPFKFNTDSCYIPAELNGEDLAGKYVYVKAVVTNLKPEYTVIYDKKQVFYSHPMLIMDSSMLRATAQEPETPTNSLGDNRYRSLLKSDLGQDLMFSFSCAKLPAEKIKEGFNISLTQRVYKSGEEDEILYEANNGDPINLKDYAKTRGIYFVEQIQELAYTTYYWSAENGYTKALEKQIPVTSRTDIFRVEVDLGLPDYVDIEYPDGSIEVDVPITLEAYVEPEALIDANYWYVWKTMAEGSEEWVTVQESKSPALTYTFEDETPQRFRVSVHTDADGEPSSRYYSYISKYYLAPGDPISVITKLTVGGETRELEEAEEIYVTANTEVSMSVEASGGKGAYTYLNYTAKYGTLVGNSSEFRFDTSKLGTTTYYTVVDDEYGNRAGSKSVTVHVAEPMKVIAWAEDTYIINQPRSVDLWVEYTGTDVTVHTEELIGENWVLMPDVAVDKFDHNYVYVKEEGTHNYRVVLTDGLGNVITKEFTVTYDSEVPTKVAAGGEGGRLLQFRTKDIGTYRTVFYEGEEILVDHTADFVYDALDPIYREVRQYYQKYEGVSIEPALFDVDVHITLTRHSTPSDAYLGLNAVETIYDNRLKELPTTGIGFGETVLAPGYYHMDIYVTNNAPFAGQGSLEQFSIYGGFEVVAADAEHVHDYTYSLAGIPQDVDGENHAQFCICGDYTDVDAHTYSEADDEAWTASDIQIDIGGNSDYVPSGVEYRYCEDCMHQDLRWANVNGVDISFDNTVYAKPGDTFQLTCSVYAMEYEDILQQIDYRYGETYRDAFARAFNASFTPEEIARIKPANQKVVWSSEDEDYATVDQSGVVTIKNVDMSDATIRVDAVQPMYDWDYEEYAYDNAYFRIECDHNMIKVVPEVPATCKSPGTKEHYACAYCDLRTANGFFTDDPNYLGLEIEVTGHKISAAWSSDASGHYHACEYGCSAEWNRQAHTYNVEAADCMTAKYCTVCGYEAQPQQSHRMIIHSATATCEGAGMNEHYQCIFCKNLFMDAAGTLPTTEAKLTVKSLGHSFEDATCTAAATCTRCGESSGAAAGHKWLEASCDAPRSCAVCHITEGKALGHDWTPATCAAPKTCTVCHVTEGKTLAHTADPATCTADSICSVCGQVVEEALPHKYVDGVCSVCHGEQPDVTVVQKEIGGNAVSVKGNVVTVTPATPAPSEIAAPCKVGYLKGDAYVEIAATKSGDDYIFEVPSEIEEVVIVVEGDANGDGEVNSADASALLAALLGKGDPMKAEQSFASNVNGDKKTNVGDLSRLTAVLLGVAALEW